MIAPDKKNDDAAEQPQERLVRQHDLELLRGSMSPVRRRSNFGLGHEPERKECHDGVPITNSAANIMSVSLVLPRPSVGASTISDMTVRPEAIPKPSRQPASRVRP
jgi:hypothetical protein